VRRYPARQRRATIRVAGSEENEGIDPAERKRAYFEARRRHLELLESGYYARAQPGPPRRAAITALYWLAVLAVALTLVVVLVLVLESRDLPSI
jgi:hypothetical protein